MVNNVHGEGRAAIIASDYMNKARRLRPSLVSIEPKEEISAYFQSAMQCWLFGLNTAALILCWSVIEYLLTEAFKKKGLSLTKEKGKYKSEAEIINEASDNLILDSDTKRMAHDVRELRRLAVHHISQYHGRNIGETETFNVIMNTKKIIDKLLTRDVLNRISPTVVELLIILCNL
jgi:hypothetical protein